MDEAAVKVSVLIPVHNRRDLVGHAIRSALEQEVDGLEVVVSDNASTDGTWEAVQAIRDPRLRSFRNPANLGMFPNFDRCAAQARGRYSVFLCSDDWLQPGFLREALPQMETASRAVLLSSRGVEVDEQGRALGRIADLFRAGIYDGRSVAAAWFWAAYHYGANPLNYPSGVLLRTDALRACLPFRAEAGAPADIDMFLRVLRHGDLLVTDTLGCSVMKHGKQAGSAARTRVSREHIALMDRFRDDLEAAGAYERVRRQSSALAFAALARIALREPARLAQEFHGFGRGIFEMSAAAAKCLALRALALLGVRPAPYLRGPASLEPMWFLRDPDPLPCADLAPAVRTALADLREHGVAVLPGNMPHDACDALVADFEAYCRSDPDSANYRDEHSLHERLACLHLASAAARRVAFDPSVLAIMSAAFRSPPLVVGSLFFEKGSTQDVHRDTPAFFTNPLNHFFGVWTALEDVRPGAGPLSYYRGGHRVAPDETLYGNAAIDSRTYFRTVVDACRAAGLELVELYPKKGDTVIWHPQLPHGGAPITRAGASRRSLVVHYIPDGVPIHGADTFFDPAKPVARSANYRKVRFQEGEAIDQVRPRFFHNRYEGNFDEA